MADARIVLTLLVLIAGCLIVLTAAVLVTLSELRAFTRKFFSLLPQMERMMTDSSESLHRLRQILSRVNETSRCVEAVVRQACSTTADALDRLASMKAKAESFLMGHIGNGTRADPRRRHTS
jgi:hypothetical protein